MAKRYLVRVELHLPDGYDNEVEAGSEEEAVRLTLDTMRRELDVLAKEGCVRATRTDGK